MIGYTYSRQFGLTRKGKPKATWGRKVLPSDIGQEWQTAESYGINL